MSTSALSGQLLNRLEDLFVQFGVRNLTMDEVASHLGISKKTLYQWFSSKNELVLKVLGHHISKEKATCLQHASSASNAIEEMLIVLEYNSREFARMRSNIIYELQKYHPEAWQLIQRFQHDFMLKVIRDNIERGRREGVYRLDFNIDVIIRLHLGTVMNLFDPTLFPDDQFTRPGLFREYMLYHLHGLATPKGLAYLQQKLIHDEI